MAGEAVAIGSRDLGRAEQAARDLQSKVPGASVHGGINAEIVAASDVVVVAVPYSAVQPTLQPLGEAMAGKIAVSVVAAVEFVDGRPRLVSVAAGSVGQEVAAILPGSRVVSAFHTLSAEKLADCDASLHEDTIVCSDDREARGRVIDLAEQIQGLRALSGGRLANSYYLEQFVGMLALMNRIHKAHTGLRIADVEPRPA